MSVINPNQFASGFAAPNVLSDPETGLGQASSGSARVPAQNRDSIAWGSPVTLPIESPVLGGPSAGDPSPPSGGLWSFAGIMNEIGNVVSNLLSQLGNAIGNDVASFQPPTSPTTPTGQETLFASATAASKGDPHLSFDGTNANGAVVSDAWDSMTSHGNLLSSDSFSGGYRVSTQVTQPNANGVTYNKNATVTTDGGATAVTMQKDGSYSVTENGASVSLTKGRSTALGNGETVELNNDGSLTIADTSSAGGTLSTTLKSNGHGGVDVTNTASNVDLGGFLVDKSDADYDPVASAGSAPATTSGVSYESPLQSYAPNLAFEQPPYSYEQPLQQFDPDEQSTSLGSIEYA